MVRKIFKLSPFYSMDFPKLPIISYNSLQVLRQETMLKNKPAINFTTQDF